MDYEVCQEGLGKFFCEGKLFAKKMVAGDLRVCLGGLTPPFRASPKTANVVFPHTPSKKLLIKKDRMPPLRRHPIFYFV
jgi:hypothetical protein